jgi:glutamyl-tRNA reductase
MDKSLRYISISHKTASMAQREEFHIQETRKSELVKGICTTFSDISGVLLLVTCNRTEVYFESINTSATQFLDYFINSLPAKKDETTKSLFENSDKTEDAVKHLLEVTCGLLSSVLGDAEIVHQIKKSYQFSIEHKLQGSLLERAMQTVFKSHKRISNETHFRDGTTSVAYKSLKVLGETFDKTSLKTKRILFIGAGDIVKQLFKYNSKFKYNNIYVSNRTEEKARILSNLHQSRIFPWDKVQANEFQGFDVIITAASNCPQLIKKVPDNNNKTLLIDLAIPCNIDKSFVTKDNMVFYDLDSISVDLEETKEHRIAAIGKVKLILAEELSNYTKWLQAAPLRAFLAEYKLLVNQKVVQYFDHNSQELNKQNVKIVTDRVVRKLRKKTLRPISTKEMEDAIAAQGVFFLEEQPS